MNSIEERLRAASRRTAAEITEDSVPPLRLAAARERFAGQRPGESRPARRRVLVPLAAAAAIAALVTVFAAVRDSGAVGRPRPGPAAARTQPAGLAPPRSRLNAEVLDVFLPATGAEFTAGGRLLVLTELIKDSRTASCMHRLGLSYRPPSAAAVRSFIGREWFNNTQFPDLARIARTQMAPVTVGDPRAHDGSPRARALAGCERAAAAPWKRLWLAGGRLESPWLRQVAQIQSSARVRAAVPALRACAARHGWHGRQAIASYADFFGWIAGHLDGPGSRGASNSQMRRLGRAWTHVLISCGRRIIAIQEAGQSAQRALFVRDHASQVKGLEHLAWRIIAAAERRAATGGS